MKKVISDTKRFIRTNKVNTRLISLVLTLLLLFSMIPTVIYAEVFEAVTNEGDVPYTVNDGEAFDESYLGDVYEIEELRGENVKHFRLEDGSYIAAQYAYPVHSQTEEGAFVDIDNRLIESGNEYSTSNSRIKFAKKLTGNGNLFTLHENNTKITMSLVGAKKKTVGRVTSDHSTDDKSEILLSKFLNLENLSSIVLYEDILDGVDVEYIVHSTNIKENIIVKEKSGNYSYSFILALNNLTAEIDGDGAVSITNDSGEVAYKIPAPIVYDSERVYAPKDAAVQTLEDMNNGKYMLTVSVSAAWMNDETRAFPVTVDPAIIGSCDSYEENVYVCSDNSESGISDGKTLYVGEDYKAYWNSNEAPVLPEGSYITDASLSLYLESEGEGYVGIYEVTETGEDNAAPEVSDVPLDYVYVTTGGNYYTFDVTSNVKNQEAEENTGLCIAPLDGYTFIEDSTAGVAEYAAMSQSPRLTVSYIDQKGIEEYMSYSSQSAGVGGNVNVNLATGNMVVTIPTLTTTDALMPYTPILVYDSTIANSAYTYGSAEVALSSSYMPYGFKLNMFESVIKKSYVTPEGTSGICYIYSDADGTEHYFYPQSSGSSVYVDDSGLGKVLTVVSGNVQITDDSKVTRIFKSCTVPSSAVSGAWYLTEIKDMVGNSVKFFTGSDTSARPSRVSMTPIGSSEIVMLNLSYNSAGKLSMIYNSASKEAVVLRYSSTYNGALSSSAGAYLRRVDRANGNASVTDENWSSFLASPNNTTNVTIAASSLYTYDSTGRITAIEDTLSAQELLYSWDNGKVTSVSHYAGESLGQSLLYNYTADYTEITSSGTDDLINTDDDVITRHIFDNRGRSISVYSYDAGNKEIYGATVGKYETYEKVKNNLKEQSVIGGTSVNYLLNGSFENGTSRTYTPNWTFTDNIIFSNSIVTGTGSYSAIIEPEAGTEASISQNVYLDAGHYTLSLEYNSYKCAGLTCTANVLSGNTVIHSEEIAVDIDTGQTTGMLITSFEISTAGTFKIEIDVSANSSVNASAALYLEYVMLEKQSGASRYSYVDYGGFDASSRDSAEGVVPIANYWNGENCNVQVADGGELFGNALKIPAATGTRYVGQRIFTESFPAYDNFNTGQFLVSGYAKAASALPSSTGIFRLRVDVYYFQGSGEDDVVKSFYFDFTPECADWQFTGGLLDTEYIPESSSDSNSYSCVTAIDIICEFSNQTSGYALFDNISVTDVSEMDSEKYTYYTSGTSAGLLKTKSTYFYTEYYFYDNSRRISRKANNKGELWDYVYWDNGTIRSIIEYDYVQTNGQIPDYPYNAANPDSMLTKTGKTLTEHANSTYGQTMGTYVYPIDNSGNILWDEDYIIRSYKEYNVTAGSRIFGTLKSEYDSLDVDINYYYDQNNGRLLAVVNRDENTGTAYTYDAVGNLTDVVPATYVTSTKYGTVTNAESVDYMYDSCNRLSEITTDSTTYSFTYDDFGNITSTEAGNYELASYEYGENNGKLKKITYSNGLVVEYSYNTLEKPENVWYTKNGTQTLVYEYEYTADGKLHTLKNNLSGRTLLYKYDVNGRLINYREYTNDDLDFTYASDYSYNDQGNLRAVYQKLNYRVGTDYAKSNISYSYTYDTQGRLTRLKLGNNASGTLNYSYDRYGRLTTKNFTAGSFTNNTSYTYSKYSQRMSPTQVKVHSYTLNGTTYSNTYTYDYNGNITKVVGSDGKEIRYVYDDLNQLIREDNGIRNETYVYTYDNAGNITSKKTYNLTAAATTPSSPKSTKTYTYGDSTWGDRLTKYNGTTITYDSIGNPLSYYNGISYSFSWTGRQLTGATAGGYTYSFTYSDEGARTSKLKNGAETVYYYDGSKLVAEERSYATFVYIYDAEGSPIGFRTREHSYASGTWDVFWYEKNLQGDVISVYNNAGTKLVSYKYDAWGNFSKTSHNSGSSTRGWYNPITYRGYYYDSDISLYVLGTRYYDPVTGRFLNADSYVSTGQGILGNNMYAYCNNNPVNFVDPTGTSAIEVYWFVKAFVFVVATLITWLGIAEAQEHQYSDAGAISHGATSDLADSAPKSIAETKEEEKTKVIPLPQRTVYFPEDPTLFKPDGLNEVHHKGTKNGKLISWMDPVTNKVVFRWDENTNYPNGSHYHIYGSHIYGSEHYYAGDKVPEPYASIYFK